MPYLPWGLWRCCTYTLCSPHVSRMPSRKLAKCHVWSLSCLQVHFSIVGPNDFGCPGKNLIKFFPFGCRKSINRQDLITAPTGSRFRVDVERNWIESSKVSVLLNELERLHSLGSKSIVFSQWTAFLDLLQIAFSRLHLPIRFSTIAFWGTCAFFLIKLTPLWFSYNKLLSIPDNCFMLPFKSCWPCLDIFFLSSINIQYFVIISWQNWSFLEFTFLGPFLMWNYCSVGLQKISWVTVLI